ncbi:MAG: VirB3 family type IV secretion system protein [Ruminobacter sp.]|nr:VirB3 family type IV secretion system protein [Ruminobacter sp.]
MLRNVPIHRSLHRVNTFMGGDREVIMMAGLITVASIAVGQNMISAVFGIIFWFMVLIPARKIAKVDPLMRPVFLASLNFKQKYFPPHSHVLANNKLNYKAVMTKSGMKY